MKKLINPKVQFVVSTIFLLIIMFLSAYAIRVKADSEHQKSVLYGNKKIAIKEIKKTFADGINQYTKGDLSEDELNQYIASMITDKMEDTDAFTQKELTTIDTSIKNYLDTNGVHKKIDKNTKSINDIYNLTNSIYENNLEYANKIESSLKDAIEKDKKDNTKTYSDLVEEDQLLLSWINEVKTSTNENKTNLDKIINNTTSWNENTNQNIGAFEDRINSIESLINKNQEENLKNISNNAQDIKVCAKNNQINNKLTVDNQKKISDIETSLNSHKKDITKNTDELTKQNSIIEKNNKDILNKIDNTNKDISNKIDNTNNDISTKYGYLVNMMNETDDKNTKAISDITDKTSLIETDYKKQISDLNEKFDKSFEGCVQRESELQGNYIYLSGLSNRAYNIAMDITSEDGDLAKLRAEDKSIRDDMDVMGKSLASSISSSASGVASSMSSAIKYNRDEVEKELKDTNDIITQFKESEDKIDKAFREDINSILSELKEMKSKEDSDIISVKEDVTNNKNNIEKSISTLDKVVNKVSSLESTVNTNKQTQDKVNESINKKNSTQDKNIDTLIKQLGGSNFKILTEAEYQALVDNNTVDENTIYFIK